MPVVTPETRVVDALLEMTRKGLGLTAVTDAAGRVLGVFTDGDLRRALDRGAEVLHLPVGDVMTRHCKTVQVDMLAAEALRIMQDSKINALLVVDARSVLVGVLNMHDLLKAKVL
jgi:arabinose-5-phosphate isomerase